MAVFRVNKTADYTTISNHHLKNRNLSLKAKGLLSVMLSLPDDWHYSIGGLVSISVEGESAIKTTLTELKQNGYIRITKLDPSQTASGRFEYIYDVFERPQASPQDVENPVQKPVDNQKQEGGFLPLENLGLENQGLENRPVYKYTNTSSTNNKITNNHNSCSDDLRSESAEDPFAGAHEVCKQLFGHDPYEI